MATELTKKQFDILEALATSDKAYSQRDLEKITGYSLGTVNKLSKELADQGFIDKSKITKKGLDALEPYRAKRAVFIAAGFGSRMVPITLNTPKPLVRVNGKRIIDTLIDACLAAGIEEIYIVRGYLAEQFDQLLYKYPMIKFLENPSYNDANNISSALVARYLLSNAYVLEADLVCSNPEIIKKYHYVLTAGRWSASLIGMKLTVTSSRRISMTYSRHQADARDTGSRFPLFTARTTIKLRSRNALMRTSSRSIHSRN